MTEFEVGMKYPVLLNGDQRWLEIKDIKHDITIEADWYDVKWDDGDQEVLSHADLQRMTCDLYNSGAAIFI